ncbi:GWxTD domain-containing protein [Schleiferia thermophila]|jgi:GWxTD domain-containing protein|uniref:GWxTD domain-containing protein n=2 Tax=Schleiferia thermophila TaxID=884107 RepID=A0A369A326_9FLAO|nr:GWxTD domain-containing protein [Schleiferia thermophila]
MRFLWSNARSAMQKNGINYVNCLKSIAGSALVLLIATACKTSPVKQGFTNINFSNLYQPSETLLKPDVRFQFLTHDSAELHYKISEGQFLYMRDSEIDDFIANVELHYAIVTGYSPPVQILDSGSIKIKIKKSEQNGKIIGSIPIEVKSNENIPRPLGLLTVKDLNRNLEYSFFEYLDRSSNQSRTFFNIEDSEGNPLVNKYFYSGDTICVTHPGSEKIFVRYLFEPFHVAQPPFSNSQEELNIGKVKYLGYLVKDSSCMCLEKSGFYLFQIDTTSLEGFYLMVRNDDYPLINRRNQLVGPLRYLTTQREFDNLQANEPDSLKFLADQFWLLKAGNPEKARNLVKAYYGRVQRANELFTSFKEGWKTDRGMIYIIFGPPNIVYRYNDKELWIYGDDNSTMQYRFNFHVIRLPFSGFYHVLERNDQYRYIWGQAVDAWRNGRIYSIRDIKKEQDERDQQIRLQRQPYFWF